MIVLVKGQSLRRCWKNLVIGCENCFFNAKCFKIQVNYLFLWLLVGRFGRPSNPDNDSFHFLYFGCRQSVSSKCVKHLL